MPKFDVVTIGGVVRDFTLYTSKGRIIDTPDNLTAQKMLGFEYGAKVPVDEAYHGVGGGAANAAVCLSKLGLKAGIITRVGTDNDATDIIFNFKEAAVDVSLIQKDQQVHSGLSCIICVNKRDREHVAFAWRGANDNLVCEPQQFENLSTRWVYLTALSGKQWNKNLQTIFNFIESKHLQTRIAWNPGALQLQAGRRVLAEYLKKTDVLILNKDEAIELVLSGMKLGRKNPARLNKPLYLLNILKEWGPRIVVVTEGKKGAWAFDGVKMYYQKIKRAKTVDTTGVGDAFGSTFVAGLERNADAIPTALEWAMVNAGSVTTKVGAQNGLLTLSELRKKV